MQWQWGRRRGRAGDTSSRDLGEKLSPLSKMVCQSRWGSEEEDRKS